MKNLKLIFGVAAIAIGSVVAFSFTKAEKSENKVLNTYYPVKTGPSTYEWRIINPNDYECVEGAAACSSFQATTPPPNNQTPPGYIADGHVLVEK